MTSQERVPGRRVAPWRDVRVLRVVIQVVFLALVAGLILYLYNNLVTNLRRQGIGTSFEFLGHTAGFPIPNSDFDPSSSFLAAILVGVKNTALVAVTGIVLTTVLGLIVGVARLSTNWLIARVAAAYVETLRNIPVLVIIFFWYLAVITRLPPIDQAIEWGRVLVLSNRGLVVPWLEVTGNLAGFGAVMLVGAVVAGAAVVWRRRRHDRVGEPPNHVLWVGGILLVAVVVGYLAAGRPFALSLPERGELGTERGLLLSPEYGALLLGLVVYTASHIAEIVRGSILAVPKGQTEAANALALSDSQRLRFVVLPQALRTMVPPLANQYLNLTKNSSLAVAIAFPEVTRIIRIAIGQQAPAPQAIAILMLAYLAFSLTTSLLTNLFNWRVALKGGR